MNTPRTDPYDGIWAAKFVNGQSIFEHARQLERELIDANKRIEELEEDLNDWQNTRRDGGRK
jgi:hypothetical protein